MKKTKLTRSENMSRIKSKNTTIEMILRKELWKRNLRYRLHDRKIFGHPDIIFKKKKIAIFCDSEFWHGKKFLEGEIPNNNTEFWIKKLTKNIARDIVVNNQLHEQGWIVLRYWEKDIRKNAIKIADEIEQILKENYADS
ncbi:MAG: very short patch repair endonuclease [Sulfuricurvum sp.]